MYKFLLLRRASHDIGDINSNKSVNKIYWEDDHTLFTW